MIDEKAIQQLEADTQAVIVQLQSGAVIQNDAQYIAAGKLYRAADDREKEIKEYFKPTKAQAAKLHKEICAQEKDALALISGPKRDIKAAMERYDADKRRKARKEAERQEALRQEEIRKQAEQIKAASPLEQAMEIERIEESLPKVAPLPTAAAPKLGGVIFRTVADRDKIQARINECGHDHGIHGIEVWCEWKFSVITLTDVPEEYKKRV